MEKLSTMRDVFPLYDCLILYITTVFFIYFCFYLKSYFLHYFLKEGGVQNSFIQKINKIQLSCLGIKIALEKFSFILTACKIFHKKYCSTSIPENSLLRLELLNICRCIQLFFQRIISSIVPQVNNFFPTDTHIIFFRSSSVDSCMQSRS